jgi:AbrB family looped-hinge helix DNA binding protein
LLEEQSRKSQPIRSLKSSLNSATLRYGRMDNSPSEDLEMARTMPARERKTRFKAKVTGRHAITIPAEVCRALGLATGDSVEITLHDGQALLRKEPTEPTPPLRGLLSDYFTDWEDINRFIEDERQAWEQPADDQR